MTETDPTILKVLDEWKIEPVITCRLHEVQNRQLLAACYWVTLGPFDQTTVELSKLLLFRFMLHGYTAREIGGYKQTAMHLGHGVTIRKFKTKTQYHIENLSAKVLRKVKQPDGSLSGSGFKGTRGKYAQANSTYKPKRRMRRSHYDDMRIRCSHPNYFEEYKKSHSSHACQHAEEN